MSNVTEQWLSDSASIKGIFVAITVSKFNTTTLVWDLVTLYLSNVGYVTSDATWAFSPYINGGLEISEQISLDGSITMSSGDIAVNNFNGELDSWLDSTQYIWVNKTVDVYFGDPRWVASSATFTTVFEKVFTGIVDDIDSSGREQLNIKIRDSLERLNTTLSENTLDTYGNWASGQTNKEAIRPIVFGEVFNITPLLIDPSQYEYLYNDTNVGTTVTSTTSGTNILTCLSTSNFTVNNTIVFSSPTIGGIVAGTTYYIKTVPSSTTFTISTTSGGTTFALTSQTGTMQAEARYTTTESVIEIRDNGVPIYNSSITANVTVNLAAGTFKLLKAPVGTITCSVQGNPLNMNLTTGAVTTSYKNTIVNAIAIICTRYGNPSTRLSSSDLDLATNLSAFDAANSKPIGYFLSERDNVLNVCQTILSSIGAQLYMTKLGKLRILQLGVPTSDTLVAITDRDIIQYSLSISNKVPVVSTTKLGYCKNWTLQEGLVTNIPAAHKDLFAQEWLVSKTTSTDTKLTYKLDSDPPQKDTMLIATIDADAESARLTTYFKTPRVVYRFTGTSRMFILKLGQAVTLTHNRFNLSSGVTGQVVSLNYNWIAGTVDVEVIV